MKLKLLLLIHVLIALVVGTLFWPTTAVFWLKLDVAFFQAVNGSLEGRPIWQLFWALANHKKFDWFEDAIFIGFIAIAIRGAVKGLRVRKTAEFIFFLLYSAAIIYFVNQLLFREHLRIPRPSPSLVVESCVLLSDEIPWLTIKDGASRSFPGDHATTVLLFAVSMCMFASRRIAFIACLYAVFRCMPRLVVGAHWLTDILVGSSAIVAFFWGWAYCTPLHRWCTTAIERLFRRKIPSSDPA